jgi:hypothetical protein
MKRRLLILSLTMTVAAIALTLLIGIAGAAEEETSRVRLVHAIPGAPAVQVVVDGEIAYPSVSYTTVTTYTTLTAGLHTVEVWVTLAPLPPLFLISETLPLVGGTDLTVMGIGTTSSPTVTLLLDDNRPANAGKFRVVNLSPDTPTMDVYLAAEAAAIIDDLAYKEASDYVEGIGTGVLSVGVDAGGALKSVVPPTTTLYSNAVHTLFLMGMGDTLDLVATVDQRFEAKKHYAYLPLIARGLPPPTLNAISDPKGDGNYGVSWSAVAGATSYVLEEDDHAGFSSPTVVYSGASTSASISGRAPGVYYYRVKASSASGSSAWSATQSVTVQAGEQYTGTPSVSFTVTAGGQVCDFRITVPFQGSTCTLRTTECVPIVNNRFSLVERDPWLDQYDNTITGRFDSPGHAKGDYSIHFCGNTLAFQASKGTWQASK